MRTSLERSLAYLILFLFLGLDLWLIRLNLGNLKMVSALVSMAILFYCFWGLWLHRLEDRLHHSLMLEYVLLGLLTGLLFYLQLVF